MAYKNPQQQKDAMRRWYQKNRAQHQASMKESKAAKLAVLHQRLADYFATHPCVDCKEDDLVVLEFDHLPQFEKEIHISQAIANLWSWERLLKEIAKCEVVCANCHARRTAQRQGSWRIEGRYG